MYAKKCPICDGKGKRFVGCIGIRTDCGVMEQACPVCKGTCIIFVPDAPALVQWYVPTTTNGMRGGKNRIEGIEL